MGNGKKNEIQLNRTLVLQTPVECSYHRATGALSIGADCTAIGLIHDLKVDFHWENQFGVGSQVLVYLELVIGWAASSCHQYLCPHHYW